jgi:membrane fusion protein
VNAPLDGRIASQLVKVGQAVEVGQALLSVLPRDERLEAELWVPSRSIGFVAPGNVVMLRYQAYPYQKFGHQEGVVRRLSRNALMPQELRAADSRPAANEPHYRVIVALRRQSVMAYGMPECLRPGMLLEADILGERRRLIEWIFEPLYSVHGRVGAMP